MDRVEEPTKQASVRNVYGAPIDVQGKTIIPIACVTYRFGGGSETHSHADGEKTPVSDVRRGGGGRMVASPWGFMEVTEEGTRVVPFIDWRTILSSVAIGMFFGITMANRRHGRRVRGS